MPKTIQKSLDEEKKQHEQHKISRTKRIRALRKQTGLSRKDFCKQSNIPVGTQQSWEDIKGNDLTEAGANRLLAACAQLGVHATIEWLMYGSGPSPVFDNALVFGNVKATITPTTNSELLTSDKNTEGDTLQIQAELSLFYQHCKNGIDLIAPDDSMEPRFIKGERVAGDQYYGQDIMNAIDNDCIVLIEDGRILLKRLKKGSTSGHYNLVSTNPLSDAADLVISNVKLKSAAPVIWQRRNKF